MPETTPPAEGLITAAFGRHYEVLPVHAPDASPLHCVPKGKRAEYACGDRVRYAPTAPGSGVILEVLPRANLFWRSDAFRAKRLAANLTQILIVTACEPAFSPELITRALLAAESEGITAHILLNKTDLAHALPAARALLAPFQRAGYPVTELAALHDDTAAERLAPLLHGQHTLLTGQSGMGKSTLINRLIPHARAATREISTALDSGKHTTTATRLYPLPHQSWLIDSPGLQTFGLGHLDDHALLAAFPELRPHLGHCRFRDCRHQNEPGCALLAAAEAGDIPPERWQHCQRIRTENARHRQQARGW